MDIVLFALIGAHLNMGAVYWVVFGVYCFCWLCSLIKKLVD